MSAPVLRRLPHGLYFRMRRQVASPKRLDVPSPTGAAGAETLTPWTLPSGRWYPGASGRQIDRREVEHDALAGAPQQHRTQDLAELVEVFVAQHLAPVVHGAVSVEKAVGRPEPSVVDKPDHAVEVVEAVLQRSAGENEGEGAAKALDHAGGFGLPVFDALSLVENDEIPGDPFDGEMVAQDLLVVGNGEKGLPGVLLGAFLSLAQLGAFTHGIVNGRGWVAIAIVIFGNWRPVRVLLGALLFGFVQALQLRLQAEGVPVPYELLLALPYLVTILVLALTGRNANYPAALLKPYRREGA